MTSFNMKLPVVEMLKLVPKHPNLPVIDVSDLLTSNRLLGSFERELLLFFKRKKDVRPWLKILL